MDFFRQTGRGGKEPVAFFIFAVIGQKRGIIIFGGNFHGEKNILSYHANLLS